MATTFHLAQFKSDYLDALLRASASFINTNAIKIYTTPQPADPSVAPTGTLLDTITGLTGGNWQSAVGGVAVLAAPISGTSDAAGTASFARLEHASNGALIDVTASLAGGGGGIILNSLSLNTGQTYTIQALSIVAPSSLGTLLFNLALRNALADFISGKVTTIPSVGVAGTLSVYKGTPPATADTAAPSGDLLGSITLPVSPGAWNAGSSGSSTLIAALSANASATGTATYARLVKGAYVLQGSVGTSGTDFIIDNTALTSGNPFIITEATATFA